MVQYSGRANRLRYQCARDAQNLGDPLCLGIVGRDLDRFVAERVQKILEPAALDLCLAAAGDLEHERQRLDQQWRHRLERAGHEVDRAARQFHAVEPENRLVARTLEKNWEVALREQERLAQEYDAFRRTLPLTLDDRQRNAIRQLAQDIPTLWAAPTTTPQDRQQIVRMLVERIEIDIEGNTERTDVVITWAGGSVARHRLRRSVGGYSQFSGHGELIDRMAALKRTGLSLQQVAEHLNSEGITSLRGRPFTNYMVSRLLVRRGLHFPRAKRYQTVQLATNEWWLPDLAGKLDMPRMTLLYWHTRGWVHGRKLPGLRGRLILWADAEELVRLKQLRATSRGWSDCPYPKELTTPKSPPKCC